jgi:CRISPR-associated endoribonuclease Cas6/Csy4 subtype I-F
MALTHYLAVKAISSDGTPANVLLSKVLSVAHVAAARRFGVAFPGASEAQSKPTSAPDGGYRSAAEEVETYRASYLRAKPILGDSIHFFSEQETLWLISEAINRMPRGLKEFLEPSMPKPVPSGSGFVHYKRARNAVRTEQTIQRELRRTMRRHPGDPAVASDAALAERRNTIVETSRLPYISIHSASSGQDFAMRFEIIERDVAKTGDGFDGYGFGLSGATVPLIRI